MHTVGLLEVVFLLQDVQKCAGYPTLSNTGDEHLLSLLTCAYVS